MVISSWPHINYGFEPVNSIATISNNQLFITITNPIILKILNLLSAKDLFRFEQTNQWAKKLAEEALKLHVQNNLNIFTNIPKLYIFILIKKIVLKILFPYGVPKVFQQNKAILFPLKLDDLVYLCCKPRNFQTIKLLIKDKPSHDHHLNTFSLDGFLNVLVTKQPKNLNEMLHLLSENRANFQVYNDISGSLLHCILYSQYEERTPFLEDEKLLEEKIRIICEQGADVNSTDIQGKTALFLAVEFGHLGGAKILLHYKANVNALLVHSKISPLHKALTSIMELPVKREMVSLLISKGALVNSSTAKEDVPLMLTDDAAIIESLILAGANVNYKTETEKNQPLHFACKKGNLEAVKKLLEHKAMPSIKNARGETPLDLAIHSYLDNETKKAMIKLLLENGANPNAKTKLAIAKLY